MYIRRNEILPFTKSRSFRGSQKLFHSPWSLVPYGLSYYNVDHARLSSRMISREMEECKTSGTWTEKTIEKEKEREIEIDSLAGHCEETNMS